MYAVPFAEAVAEQIRANIIDGKNPSGRKAAPLDAEYQSRRAGKGGRMLRTGAFVDSIRVVVVERHGLEKSTVGVVASQVAPGQFNTASHGARWPYNPKDKSVAQAIDDVVDVILAPDEDAGSARGI
jgi:hypothetical protein